MINVSNYSDADVRDTKHNFNYRPFRKTYHGLVSRNNSSDNISFSGVSRFCKGVCWVVRLPSYFTAVAAVKLCRYLSDVIVILRAIYRFHGGKILENNETSELVILM